MGLRESNFLCPIACCKNIPKIQVKLKICDSSRQIRLELNMSREIIMSFLINNSGIVSLRNKKAVFDNMINKTYDGF